MKRFSTVLKFFLLISLSACQKEPNKETPKAQELKTLKVNIQGDLFSFHPHLGVDLNCRVFQKAVFEGLTRLDINGEPILSGAEKLEISPCLKIYTFTLKPMNWTNGEKVTAFHFANAWKKAISPGSSCLRTDLFYPIRNAEKVKKGELPLEEVKIHVLDELTLRIELEHPTPYFLNLLANPLFSPLYDDEIKPVIFNGPFKIGKWEHEKLLVLEKNLHYWDASSVKLDRVEVSQVRDANTALLMYEKNELDWIGHPFTQLPHDALVKMENSKDFSSKPIAGVYWLSLNTESFPLNCINIRKALSVALNRTSIAHHVLLGEIPTKCIVPTGVALLKDEELYVDSDAAVAMAYFQKGLEELGLTLEQFPTLYLDHSDVPGQKKLAEAIQQNWQSVFGINVVLVGSEWNVFFAKLNHRQFQIGGCIWYCVYHDPIYLLDFFRYRSQNYNTAGWENSRYQKLLDLADEEKDPSLRTDYLKQAETVILDEMPVIPLFAVNAKSLKPPNLKGLQVNDLGHVDFKWAYFE